MPTLSKPIAVRFDEDLVQLIEEVSSGQHMTKTDFIREAVLEKLEDMYDLAKAEKTYQEWSESGKKTYSHEEMMKRYG
ncbi:type II toxin-antitoxin system RelB family antitoxin [Streptococcus sp. 2022WUSS135]|uniref:type II toxin-antitoxin system RelB family antitoxin n=1 Tax=Streptococcus sp. 2022WUSS135 TaxID=2983288 RepID=UPI0037978387